MENSFAIVLKKPICVKVAYSIIKSAVRVKKIDISKNNRIAIGIDKKIFFDINKYIIKGKILSGDMIHEKEIISSIVKKFGQDKVVIHYYD